MTAGHGDCVPFRLQQMYALTAAAHAQMTPHGRRLALDADALSDLERRHPRLGEATSAGFACIRDLKRSASSEIKKEN